MYSNYAGVILISTNFLYLCLFMLHNQETKSVKVAVVKMMRTVVAHQAEKTITSLILKGKMTLISLRHLRQSKALAMKSQVGVLTLHQLASLVMCQLRVIHRHLLLSHGYSFLLYFCWYGSREDRNISAVTLTSNGIETTRNWSSTRVFSQRQQIEV